MFDKTKLRLTQPIKDVGNMAMAAMFTAAIALIVALIALEKKG